MVSDVQPDAMERTPLKTAFLVNLPTESFPKSFEDHLDVFCKMETGLYVLLTGALQLGSPMVAVVDQSFFLLDHACCCCRCCYRFLCDLLVELSSCCKAGHSWKDSPLVHTFSICG